MSTEAKNLRPGSTFKRDGHTWTVSRVQPRYGKGGYSFNNGCVVIARRENGAGRNFSYGPGARV